MPEEQDNVVQPLVFPVSLTAYLLIFTQHCLIAHQFLSHLDRLHVWLAFYPENFSISGCT